MDSVLGFTLCCLYTIAAMLLYVVSLASAVHYCKTMLEMAPYLLWLFGKVLNRIKDGDGMEDLENQPLLNDMAGRSMQTRNMSIWQQNVMVNGQALPVHQSQPAIHGEFTTPARMLCRLLYDRFVLPVQTMITELCYFFILPLPMAKPLILLTRELLALAI